MALEIVSWPDLNNCVAYATYFKDGHHNLAKCYDINCLDGLAPTKELKLTMSLETVLWNVLSYMQLQNLTLHMSLVVRKPVSRVFNLVPHK